MRYFLESISIEGFRGINNAGAPLTIPVAQDAFNSLYGENARGKTSTFQALRYALTGDIPALAQIHQGEVGEDDYTNHFHPARVATISLSIKEIASGTSHVFTVVRDTAGNRSVTAVPPRPDPEAFLRSLAGPHTFLDNETLAGFVRDTPLKRGRTFSGLLGLELLSQARQAFEVCGDTRGFRTDFDLPTLQSRRASVLASRDALKRQCSEGLHAITGRPAPEDASSADYRTLALSRLRTWTVISDIVGSDTDTPDFEQLREALGTGVLPERERQLGAVVGRLSRHEELRVGPVEQSERAEALALAVGLREALTHTGGAALQRAYTATLDVLEEGSRSDIHVCPVCESTLSVSLVDHITDRLKAYDEVQRLVQRLGQAIGSSRWNRILLRLLGEADLAVSSVDQETFRLLNHSLDGGGDGIVEAVEAVFGLLDNLRERLNQQITRLSTQRDELAASLPQSAVQLAQQMAQVEQVFNAASQWDRHVEQLRGIDKDLALYARYQDFLERALQSFVAAEVMLSTSRVSALESLYLPMYERITREPEVRPRLVKRPNTEELYLVLERFYGASNLKAKSLLSESFRNALALSVFLSAALTTPSLSGFLVLDDVTSSLDGGHQFFLLDELRRTVGRPHNPTGLQIVFLSHDGVLEKSFEKANQAADWRHWRYSGLPPVGPIAILQRSAGQLRQAVTDSIATGSTSGIGAQLRQYLEAALLEIVRNTKVRVPIDLAHRDDTQMAGELLKAIAYEMEWRANASVLILRAGDVSLVRTGLIPGIVGNLTSHFSTGTGAGLTPNVYRGALQQVDDLVAAFKYTCRCGASPQSKYFKNLGETGCSCNP